MLVWRQLRDEDSCKKGMIWFADCRFRSFGNEKFAFADITCCYGHHIGQTFLMEYIQLLWDESIARTVS
jgi:hypothetical protein